MAPGGHWLKHEDARMKKTQLLLIVLVLGVIAAATYFLPLG